MKRSFSHISLILILVMITGALAACGGKSSNYGLNPKKPVTVKLWYVATDKRSEAYGKMIEEFNGTEGLSRGIIVEAERYESEQKLAEAALAENASLPDMLGVSTESELLYDKGIKFADINNLVAVNTKESIFEEYIEAGSYGENKEWRLFPVVKDTYVLGVNPMLWSSFMEESEHHTTELNLWEGCAVVGKIYYDYRMQSMMTVTDPADYLVYGSAQFGNPIINIEGSQTVFRVDGDTFRTLWYNYYGSNVEGGYITAENPGLTDLIEGTIPIMTMKSSETSELGDMTATEGDALQIGAYEIVSYPQFKSKKTVCPVDNTGIAIIENDDTRAFASELFLEWLTSDEINLKFACLANGLPVNKHLVSTEGLETFLDESKTYISDLDYKTLMVAMKQYEECESIYMPPMSEKYASLLNYLKGCMLDEATNDRYSVDDQTYIGIKRAEAVAKYVSEEHFGTWIADFKNGLPQE